MGVPQGAPTGLVGLPPCSNLHGRGGGVLLERPHDKKTPRGKLRGLESRLNSTCQGRAVYCAESALEMAQESNPALGVETY